MAGRGRLCRPGAGVPGRAPCLPQLVRLAARASARAAGSGTPGSGPSTAASRSGSPATASPSTGPGCTSPRSASCGCAGRASCPRCRPASPCIREPDGRFYASFVVERDPTPLPPVARTAGIDLGLVWFAHLAASDGTVETTRQPAAPARRKAAPGPRPSATCPASRRGRRTGRGRACGSRSPTVGSATGGPTIFTSWPCG